MSMVTFLSVVAVLVVAGLLARLAVAGRQGGKLPELLHEQ